MACSMKEKILRELDAANVQYTFIDNGSKILNISRVDLSSSGDLCYYDGDNEGSSIIKGKQGITLICNLDFNHQVNENASYFKTDDPKLVFYKLTKLFKPEKQPSLNHDYSKKYPNCFIYEGVEIGENVEIYPNVVIYPNTIIESDVVIHSGAVIGTCGALWTYDGEKKVIPFMNGGVLIKEGTHISSNVVVVRGTWKEKTIVRENCMLAPGCSIGHGSDVGERVHISPRVVLGGSSKVGSGCFLGIGSIINPRVTLKSNSVMGSGSVLTKNYDKSGVFVGTPAKILKKVSNNLSGIPSLRS